MKPPIMVLGRNGHIYFWDSIKSRYVEAREVGPDDLPYDVKQKIRQQQEAARHVLAAAKV